MKFLWRIWYQGYRMTSSLRHWSARRFTQAGLMVCAALIMSAILAPDTDNNTAYQALAFLLASLVLAIAFAFSFNGRFAAMRYMPRFATAGSAFTYRVRIQNLTARTQAGLVLIDGLADPRPAFKDWVAFRIAEERQTRSFRFSNRRGFNPFRNATVAHVAVPLMPPASEITVEVGLTPLRRGILRFENVTLGRADPLGLFRAFAKTPAPQNALVLPRRYALPSLALPGAFRYQQGGVALSSNVGRSDEFVALRDYRHGDPLRHIHWRSWAKTGRPVVKEFEDEFFVRHALVLDTFLDHPFSEIFEEAVSVAASFASTLHTQESLLDLLFVGSQSYCFTSGRGLGQVDQMLEVLASVKTCNDEPFEKLELLVLNHLSLVSGCICVLVGWDEIRREFVRKMRAMGMPLLVLVVTLPGAARLDPGPMNDQPEQFVQLELGQVEQRLATLK
jgi:uncharacterized protein (DUF58 family)